MTIPATGKLTTEPLSGPDTDCTPYVRNAPGDGQVYVEGTEKDKIGLQLPLERLTSEEKFSQCAAFPNYLLLHPEFCVSDSSSDKFDSYPCLRLSQSSLASSSTEPTSRLVDPWVQLPYNCSFARSLSDSSLNHLPGCGATTGSGQLPGRCCTKDRYHLQVPGRPMYKCQCADQCARSAVTLSPALHSEEQMDNSLDRHHRFYGSPAGLSPRASPSSSLSGLPVGAMSPWMSDSYVSSKSHSSLSAHPFLDRFDPTRSSVDTRGTSLSPRIDDDFHGQAFPYLCSRDRSPGSPYMMSPSVPSPSSQSGDTHPSPHPSPRPSPSLLSEKTQLSSDVADSHQSELRSEGTSISDSHMQQMSARSKLTCRWKLCGQRFSNQRELALHVNDDHVRIERPALDFQCHWQGCPRQGKGFNARYKMLIHIRTHTNEKPHECSVCGKCFSRLENLKIHTRSHTGEKPYVCTFPGCNKAYSNSSDRFKHVRTHQEEKPYKCKMLGCRKQYTDPSSLRKHVRTHGHTHGNNLMLRRAVSSSESYTEDSREKKLLLAETTGRRHSFEAHTDLTQRLDCDLLVQENTEQLSIQKSIELYGSLELRSGIHKLLTVDSMEGTSPQSVSPSHDRSDKPVTNCAKDSVTTESRPTVACEELRKKFDVPSIVIHEPATSVDCQPQEKITWPSHNTSGARKLTHTLSGSNIASGQAMEKQGEETSEYKDIILTSESKSQDCDEREDRQTQKEKSVPSPLAFSTSERQTQQGERNNPQNVDTTVISPGSYPVSPPTSGHPGHWKKRKLLTREREMVPADTTSPSVSQVTHHSLSPTVTLPAPVTSPCDTSPSSSSVSSSIPSIITQPPSPPLSRTSHCSDVSPALALPPPPLIPSPTYPQQSSQLIVPAPFMSRSPSIPHHSLSSPIPSSLPSPSSSLSSSSSSPHSLSLLSSPSISPSFLALPGLYSSSTSHPQVDPYPVHLLSPLTLSQSSQGHQPTTSLSIAGPKEMTKHLLPSYFPARLDHLGELNHLPPSMTLPPLTSRLGQLYQEFPLDLSPYYLHYGLTLHTASPLNVAIKR